MKCSDQTLQNLLYFWNKKTHIVFFIFHNVLLYFFSNEKNKAAQNEKRKSPGYAPYFFYEFGVKFFPLEKANMKDAMYCIRSRNLSNIASVFTIYPNHGQIKSNGENFKKSWICTSC